MQGRNHRESLFIFAITAAVIICVVYIAGLIIPEPSGNYMEASQSLSVSHIFGTDALGRDVFLRTLKGMSSSMTIGIAASLISAVIAVPVGAAAACSKTADTVISRIIDLFMSVPHIILVLLISFALGKGFFGLLVGIAATHWCSLARIIRSETLQVRSCEYVAISGKLGKSRMWIFRHHIMPNIFPQLIVGIVLMFPHAILHEAAVSFLGFGLPPEQSSIGMILSESLQYLSAGVWWSAVFPGLALIAVVLLIDKIGDGIRIIMDPYSSQE